MEPVSGGAFSVVVPAHNEEAVLARCLDRLFAGAREGELEVIVVCNGCGDRTAEIAQGSGHPVRVIEIAVASKVAALNAGDELAHHFPRFYVDADVELSIGSLRRTAEVLGRPGVLCAAPTPVFDLEARPWPVRAFYDIWPRIPYMTEDMVGSGVYALAEEGRSRFGAFPELVNDDQFVAQLFDRPERKAVPDAHFVVHPPLELAGLLAMRTRAYRGNVELAGSGLARSGAPRSGAWTALRLARQPRLAPAVVAYLSVNLVGKIRARRANQGHWERDDSARSLPAAGTTARLSTAGGSARAGSPHMCYVVSQYPALSHTFVMREVLGVRAAGLDVETVSVHEASAAHLLTPEDKVEAANTWNIFPLQGPRFLRAHTRALLAAPRAYWLTLGRALAAAPKGWRGRLWQLFYFGEAIALWDHARRRGARHLHAHLANVAADLCWLASDYGKLAGPQEAWRWSFTMHGPTELFDTERYNLSRKVAHADGVICISDFTRSQLMYLSDPGDWPKLTVAHMGVDLRNYPFVPPAQHEGLSVLCVARLVPAKGLEVLVDAIGELARRGRDVTAVVVGEGPLEGPLSRRAGELGLGDRARFAGAVGQEAMARYYAAADVFCLPSFAEGVPVVIMEAMATGRPVVTTRIAGIAELVEDGVSGVLVAPGNREQLVAALERLAISPELRANMGEAGRRKVEEQFDAVKCAHQVADMFIDMGR